MAWYDQITEKFVRNVANKYMQDQIWGPFNIFPKVNVVQKAGYLAKYLKEDWLRMTNPNDYIRTGAAESMGDDFATGKQPFVLEQYAFHQDVTEEDRDNYDNPFDPVSDATQFVINKLKLVIATKFANTVFTSGLWGVNYDVSTSSTPWDDDGSDPIADVLSVAQSIEQVTGFWPNKFCMTRDVEIALANNKALKDVMKVTSDKIVSKDLIAKAFHVDMVEVFSTVTTKAKKNQTATSANTGYIATNQALLCYAPERATTKAPSAGIHTAYKTTAGNVITRRIPMPEKNNAIRIEGIVYTNPVVMGNDLGGRLFNILT